MSRATVKLRPAGPGPFVRAEDDRHRLRYGAARGEGLCTPVEPLVVGDGEETLVPGRDRFAPSHPWVVGRPGLWRPAAGVEDRPCVDQMRMMYARALDALGAPPASTSSTTSRGGLRLPRDEDYRPLRLPTWSHARREAGASRQSEAHAPGPKASRRPRRGRTSGWTVRGLFGRRVAAVFVATARIDLLRRVFGPAEVEARRDHGRGRGVRLIRWPGRALRVVAGANRRDRTDRRSNAARSGSTQARATPKSGPSTSGDLGAADPGPPGRSLTDPNPTQRASRRYRRAFFRSDNYRNTQMAEMKVTTIRLSEKDLATLDKRRGGVDRSTYVRTLIRRDVRRRRKVKPSRAHAMQCLAELAEFDPQAAVRYAELARQDEDLERLRVLTTDGDS
jgi:hypothetical protein